MNTRPFFISLASVALSLATLHVRAGEVTVLQCPQKLLIQQVVGTFPLEGWKIVNSDNTQWLRGIGISAGEYPTEQTGFEIPTETKRLANGDVIYFHDHIIPFNSGIHDYWAVCGYVSADTFLVQKLPENVVRCEVKHLHDVTVPDRITIKCFDTPRKTK